MLGRFAGIVGVLFIVSIMIFLMIHSIPGGPFDAMPTTSEFREIPEHIREKLMAKYGLDKPLYVQYFRYMWAALRGDFGISFRYGEPVTDFISRSWPATAQLGLSAMAIGIPIGIGLGILAALRPNTWLDYLTNVVVITTFVTPVFVIAIMSIIIFAVMLRWLPSGGWGEPKQWILPTFVYAVGQIGGMARFTRASMVDAMQAEYVRTARAKGLRERGGRAAPRLPLGVVAACHTVGADDRKPAPGFLLHRSDIPHTRHWRPDYPGPLQSGLPGDHGADPAVDLCHCHCLSRH